jgi:hypothetical protein
MPFIFIGGSAHTGTTLLLKILSLHSSIHSPLGILENSLEIFNKGSLEWSKSQKWHNSPKMILLKNPSNVLHINDIQRLYPKNKIILMYRDGRDVALSMDRRGHKNNFATCCQYWLERCSLMQKIKSKNMPNVITVKYEDLIDNPIETIESILNWLGLTPENLLDKYESELNPNVIKPPNEINGINHNNLRKWQVNQPLYQSSRWREDITPEQLQIFNYICGNLSKNLGYPDI